MNARTSVFLLVFVVAGLALAIPTAAADGDTSGATINLTESQEDTALSNVESALENSGYSVPDNAMLFFDDEGRAYVLATDEPTQTAAADVTGETLAPATESQTGLIYATDISYNTSGEPANRSRINSNPAAYHGEYVALEGSVAQSTYTLDPVENEYIAQQATISIADESALETEVPTFGREAREYVRKINASSNFDRFEALQFIDPIYGTSTGRLAWSGDASGTIHGVVVNSGGTPQLYVGRVDIDATEIDSVNQLDQHSGEVVTVDANAVGTRLSAQEILLNAAPCAPGSATFPPTGCIPIPADAVVHTGVAFDGTPSDSEDIVYYAGQTNYRQSTPAAPETGRYELTGRVVDASELDPRLEGTALVLLGRERIGGIAESERSAAVGYRDDVREFMREQIVSNSSEWNATVTAAASTDSQPADNNTSSQPTPADTPDQSEPLDREGADSDDYRTTERVATATEGSGGVPDGPLFTLFFFILTAMSGLLAVFGFWNRIIGIFKPMSGKTFAFSWAVAIISAVFYSMSAKGNGFTPGVALVLLFLGGTAIVMPPFAVKLLADMWSEYRAS